MAPRLKLVLDTSVWVDILRYKTPWTPESVAQLVSSADVLIGDLIFVEVVRGAKTKSECAALISKLNEFEQVAMSNMVLAQKAIDFHLLLRSKGLTVRGTIDLLIATWCIQNSVPLLHRDRDYEGFHEHLGLKRWL
jgi:predicted nucleic acid-binding protein